MMRYNFFFIVVFLFSCKGKKPSVPENLKLKQEMSVPSKVEEPTFELPSKNMSPVFEGSTSELLDKIEQSLVKLGYSKESNISVDQYKRKAFKSEGFKEILNETQFSKPKNKKLGIIVYSYKDSNSSLKCYNAIVNSKYLDGIYKSGGFLIRHKTEIFQIASTCAFASSELDEVRKEFSFLGSYLLCYCGGKCIDVSKE